MTARVRRRKPGPATRPAPSSSRVFQAALVSAAVAVSAAILKGLTGAGVAESMLTGGGAFGGAMGLGIAVINTIRR